MSNLLPFSIHLARALKAAYPDRKVVLGGVGPSPVAREIVDAFPFIYVVVEGEGEINMLEIMRGNGDGYLPPRAPSNLDALPMPAYSLIDFNRYDAAPSVITSRGCHYECTFCTEPYNFSGSVRFRWGYPFEELPEFEETLDWVTRFEDAGVSVLLF